MNIQDAVSLFTDIIRQALPIATVFGLGAWIVKVLYGMFTNGRIRF